MSLCFAGSNCARVLLYLEPLHKLIAWVVCISSPVCFTGMEIVNEALERAMDGKDKQDWTPVSVNVAPATLTILSRQVKLKSFIHSICGLSFLIVFLDVFLA